MGAISLTATPCISKHCKGECIVAQIRKASTYPSWKHRIKIGDSYKYTLDCKVHLRCQCGTPKKKRKLIIQA